MDSQAGSDPAAPGSPPPQTPQPPTINLAALAQELRGRATTSTTTRTKTTATTAKPSPTTTTPARSPSTTTTTLARVASQPSPTTTPSTTPLTPLTTLLERVVPPAVAVAGALTRSDSGVASWFTAPDGTCAHRTLPLGTMVKVTRNQNGASATCKVSDRGPTLETGRLIDLSGDTFLKLAAKEAGLIDVRIEW